MEFSLFCIEFLISLFAKFLNVLVGEETKRNRKRIKYLWFDTLIVIYDFSIDNDVFFIIATLESFQILSFISKLSSTKQLGTWVSWVWEFYLFLV